MTDDKRDFDMGDDPQESEVAEYELYEENPPKDLEIEEEPEGGEIGISQWTAEESSVRSRARERTDDDDRPAEEAALEVDEEE
jgi:hypothetical protein